MAFSPLLIMYVAANFLLFIVFLFRLVGNSATSVTSTITICAVENRKATSKCTSFSSAAQTRAPTQADGRRSQSTAAKSCPVQKESLRQDSSSRSRRNSQSRNSAVAKWYRIVSVSPALFTEFAYAETQQKYRFPVLSLFHDNKRQMRRIIRRRKLLTHNAHIV